MTLSFQYHFQITMSNIGSNWKESFDEKEREMLKYYHIIWRDGL